MTTYCLLATAALDRCDCLESNSLALSRAMKSSVIPAEAEYSSPVAIQPSSGVLESFSLEEESSHSIPHHPLGVKPSGNQYTARSNSKSSAGPFQLFPDEILALFLEYLDACKLRSLGSTCKFLYAFCRSDDLWKSLFIEWVISFLWEVFAVVSSSISSLKLNYIVRLEGVWYCNRLHDIFCPEIKRVQAMTNFQ